MKTAASHDQPRDASASPYARHLPLTEIGQRGQKCLAAAKVLIIGIGGLGNPAAMSLAAAGIGQLTLNDYDDVDASNLARQWLFRESDVGANKADVALRRLTEQFSHCDVRAIQDRLSGKHLLEAVGDAEVVLDCTDNFASRRAIGEACRQAARILVSGAAIRCEGQLMEFGPNYDDQPCYSCLYPDVEEHIEDCQRDGILSPLTSWIGAAMATRAVLRICGQPAARHLTLVDAKSMEIRQLKIARRSACPHCGRA